MRLSYHISALVTVWHTCHKYESPCSTLIHENSEFVKPLGPPPDSFHKFGIELLLVQTLAFDFVCTSSCAFDHEGIFYKASG